MWDLIVSVPDHCLSFYFPYAEFNDLGVKFLLALTLIISVISITFQTIQYEPTTK